MADALVRVAASGKSGGRDPDGCSGSTLLKQYRLSGSVG